MMGILTVVIAVLVSVVGLITILVLGMLVVEHVAENGLAPKFPCVECKYFDDNEHFDEERCKRCVSGVSGEPRRCKSARGTLKCFTGARRVK